MNPFFTMDVQNYYNNIIIIIIYIVTCLEL